MVGLASCPLNFIQTGDEGVVLEGIAPAATAAAAAAVGLNVPLTGILTPLEDKLQSLSSKLVVSGGAAGEGSAVARNLFVWAQHTCVSSCWIDMKFEECVLWRAVTACLNAAACAKACIF